MTADAPGDQFWADLAEDVRATRHAMEHAVTLLQAIASNSAPAEEVRYCPAETVETFRKRRGGTVLEPLPPGGVVCPGGYELRRHAPEFAGEDAAKAMDNLYHPFSPGFEFRAKYPGLGEQTVKNHNVWRSKSLSREEAIQQGLLADDGDPPPSPLPDEEPDDAVYRREMARPPAEEPERAPDDGQGDLRGGERQRADSARARWIALQSRASKVLGGSSQFWGRFREEPAIDGIRGRLRDASEEEVGEAVAFLERWLEGQKA